ncbi:MAG TPA: serine protease [Humisphaera sp.]|jgi:S1-C subfamily serine protease|nr:serine protease [Humisphaera sp.]
MISKRLSVVALLISLCCAAFARGQTAEIIRHGKQCTALVVVHQGNQIGWGSAFCVSPLGFFVTNAHVIPETNVQRQVAPGGFTRQVIPGRGVVLVPRGGRAITRPMPMTLSLVLNPGEADQAVYGATITKIDRSGDLAVLYITPKAPLPTLELGDVDGLFETAPITAFGYPFGQMLADKPEDYPNISVNVGRITSLRKARGELTAIQLDASLNPGNSGGPILDEKGRLIGIVEKGIPGASINFAIPVTKLAKFLETPMASFTVTRDTKIPTKPATITMRVLAVAADAMKDATVEVELMRDNTPMESFTATKVAENLYQATAPVVIESAPPTTQAATQPSSGSAPTQPAEAAATPATQPAPAAGPPLLFHQVKFVVLIKRPGKEDGRNEGGFTIPLSDAEVAARNAAAAQLAQNNAAAQAPTAATPEPARSGSPTGTGQEVFRLPAPVNKIVCGGSGRYLVAWMALVKQVAILDTQTRALRQIRLESDDVRLSATRDKLFIVLRDRGFIGRWDLQSGRQEQTHNLTFAQDVRALASGESSAGPVMMISRAWVQLLDPNTLEPAGIQLDDPQAISQWAKDEQSWAEASADGHVFVVSNTSAEPQEIHVLRISGKTATSRSTPAAIGLARPNEDGSVIVGQRGLLDENLEPIAFSQNQNPQRMAIVPMRGIESFMAFDVSAPGELGQPALYSTLDRSRIGILPKPAEGYIRGVSGSSYREPPLFDRLQLIPSQKLMINLDPAGNRWNVHQWDVEQRLTETGSDYLFVMSTPPRFSRAGPPFHYQIKTASKRGGVSYALESGPRGMFILPDGLLRWQPPATPTDEAVAVVVRIKDGAGREIRYSFKLWAE